MKHFNLIVLCVLISFAVFSVGLDGKGVCQIYVRYNETKYIYYHEPYRVTLWGTFYNNQIRGNWKRMNFFDYRKEDVCCDGYEVSSPYYDRCQPVCKTDCEHGYCTSRNVCECEPEYQMSIDEPHICEPLCHPPCINGKCTAPGTCTCNPGYTWKYLPYGGYDRFNCEPSCDSECVEGGGFCMEPHICQCHRGYKLIVGTDFPNTNKCVPICERNCTNGECTGPNFCSCNEGYVNNPDDFLSCVPRCSDHCTFGSCTSANICVCYKGYVLNTDGICEPICSKPCVNGTCIAAETCSCNKGFGLTEDSAYVCQPICEEACINGTCTAPAVCSCHEGYKLSGDERSLHVCEPHCKIPCEPFGKCTAPDTCICSEGYRLVDKNSQNPGPFAKDSACEPVCAQNCVNGYCSAPNVCSCKKGFMPSENGSTNTCKSLCDKPCGPNGFCGALEKCECNDGYRFKKEDQYTYVCEPICDVDCGNGTCKSPNVCTCDEGYQNDATGRCVPFCTSCKNGTCIGPETCECNNGFILTEPKARNESVCQPYCNNCLNGDCVAPGNCQCHEGFVKNKNDGSKNRGNNVGCISACENVCNNYEFCNTESRSCECRVGWKGINCSEPSFCVMLVDSNVKDTTKFNIADYVDETAVKVFANNPRCHFDDCIDGNDILCFKNYNRSDIKKDRLLGCLVDTDSTCYAAHGALKATSSAPKVAGIVGGVIVIIISLATVTYFLLRKHRRRKVYLGNVPAVSTEGGTSMLMENDSNL